MGASSASYESLNDPQSLEDRARVIQTVKDRVAEEDVSKILDMIGVDDPKLFVQPEGDAK